MGLEGLLKGQNGLLDCGTFLAHHRKSLAIGKRCPYLLKISTPVQCVNIGKFYFYNIIKPPFFSLWFYYLKIFY